MDQYNLTASHGTAPQTWSSCNCGVYPNVNHVRKFSFDIDAARAWNVPSCRGQFDHSRVRGR